MRVLVVVAILACAADANAQSWRKAQGGAILHYELSGWSAVEKDAMREPKSTELVLAGARLHGFVARNRRVAYHIGLDLFAGSTIRDAGFAYDVALFPAGVMLRMGKTAIAGVSVGIGANGAIGTLDDAVVFPVDAVLEFGNRVRVLSRARVSFLGATSGLRQSRAPSLPIGDEFEAMVGVRVGKHEVKYRAAYGFGYFVGVSYREQADAHFLGATIGFSIDMASHRRSTDDGW
jgi:hypothetical protein